MIQKIYLGPTMAGQGITITNGTIFNGPASQPIEERKAEDAKFAALFVSISEVGQARAGIRNGGTFLAQCYKEVYQNYMNGKQGEHV